jgi:hypothetical protein
VPITLRQQAFALDVASPFEVALGVAPLSGSRLVVWAATGDADNGSLDTPAGWTDVTGVLQLIGGGGAGSRAKLFEKESAGAADQTFSATGVLWRGLTILELAGAGARQAAPLTLQDESQTTADMTPGPVTPAAGLECVIVNAGVNFQHNTVTGLDGATIDENRDNSGNAPPMVANPSLWVCHRIIAVPAGSYNIGAHDPVTTEKFATVTVIYSGAGGAGVGIPGEPGGGVF